MFKTTVYLFFKNSPRKADPNYIFDKIFAFLSNLNN